MQDSIIPITAVVAVLVFILREIFEAVRRKRADDRKRSSLRVLLARECELNNWTIKRLRDAVGLIEGPEKGNSDPNRHLSIQYSPRGKAFLRSEKENGDYSQTSLPEISRNISEKFMLDVAMLDKKLLSSLVEAYDELAHAAHVRDSLIDFILSIDEDDRLHLTSFPDYAFSQLSDAFEALETLYRECTGNALTKHRLR